MAEGTTSPVVSPVASALSSSVSSPRGSGITPDDKACDLIEEAVPMVIVQQFIKDNKEKGMPVNQKMSDLKKKQAEIKNERQQVAAELRNEERKRARLKTKANKWSAEDLVQVLAVRATASNAKKLKTEAANEEASSPAKKQ